ncbi:DUF2849 domain-containing protein [Maritalea mediterranea]|uniref:DUF2849 domain-containing protein n=1 Tax=Maritalea mediterranea TaxID=2909667 RepID=A0ABS9EAC5_9HYPH|nr:DUF2849 domain-containing protein [Maritalea mediterranea]MCF4098849.1 DUF2849 domain-containing protein [Maritalea mediterranea]
MKVITGNELLSGAVIYYYGEDRWGMDLQQAEVFDDKAPELDAVLDATAKKDRVMSLEAIPVEREDNKIVRTNRLREEIRAKGPTVGNYGRQHLSEADYVSL